MFFLLSHFGPSHHHFLNRGRNVQSTCVYSPPLYLTPHSSPIPRIFFFPNICTTMSCHLLFKDFQQLPVEFRIKSKVHALAYITWPCFRLTSCHVNLLLHRILHLQWLPACFSHLATLFLCKDICTCCVLCLQSASSS